ncbi:MAG TPA: hypothetical protein PLM53_09090 [Spirochaetota bacterium]|nr:hypothetical protein [Spirochaetota bacterium]HPC40118.1 hypothetical protein [Spirochaetota bacterium]HPL15834.1 hypothetical protein [Spirochaetota bacterium]HQF08522.1 hypothetical protein [Spirochaetota bacterium]HQH97241.1 hypothetical protein [Spirochaetota bacterium]
MNYIDQIFDFKGRWDAPSRCGLKVVKKQDRHIVIVTELFEENPGTSVTEFNTKLADIIVREFSLDPEKLLFIEHNPDRGSKLDHYRESFDIVYFQRNGGRFSDPEWERVTRDRIDELIG